MLAVAHGQGTDKYWYIMLLSRKYVLDSSAMVTENKNKGSSNQVTDTVSESGAQVGR